MSFILDALKKSERERQKKNAPGFADVAEGSDPPRAPRWLWVLGLLLAVNVVALLGVMLRPDTRPAIDLPAPDDTTLADDRPSDEALFSEMVEEAKRKQPQDDAEAPTASVDVPESPSARPQSAESSATVAGSYATFDELRANGTLNLPDLHLDIHVYSDQPAERFVFVNMNKYREQGRLAEGPLVKEITPEGVILEHLGNGFLLPRE